MPVSNELPKPTLGARLRHRFGELTTIEGILNRERDKAVERILPSTVSIHTVAHLNKLEGGSEDRLYAEGSGFVIAAYPGTSKSPDFVDIATNKHVVEEALRNYGMLTLEVVTSGAQGKLRNPELKTTFKKISPEDVWMSPNHDVAFIRMPLGEHPEISLPAVKQGFAALVDSPDELFSVGAPLAVEDTITLLHASQNGLTKICNEEGCDNYLQISVTNPGNSGGPVVDPAHRGMPPVVGMVTLGAENNPTIGYMLTAERVWTEYGKFQMAIANRSLQSSRRK